MQSIFLCDKHVKMKHGSRVMIADHSGIINLNITVKISMECLSWNNNTLQLYKAI